MYSVSPLMLLTNRWLSGVPWFTNLHNCVIACWRQQSRLRVLNSNRSFEGRDASGGAKYGPQAPLAAVFQGCQSQT